MTEIVFDISSEGLEPIQHRIIGISVKTALEERIFTSRNEKHLLEMFWAYLKNKQFDKLIGFNSDNFDVPFLIVRSIKHKIPILNIRDKSIDLRKILFGDQHRKGTLTDFQHLLGIEIVENGYAKMHMSLMWERDNMHNLKECLLNDVRITWKLYLILRRIGLID